MFCVFWVVFAELFKGIKNDSIDIGQLEVAKKWNILNVFLCWRFQPLAVFPKLEPSVILYDIFDSVFKFRKVTFRVIIFLRFLAYFALG